MKTLSLPLKLVHLRDASGQVWIHSVAEPRFHFPENQRVALLEHLAVLKASRLQAGNDPFPLIWDGIAALEWTIQSLEYSIKADPGKDRSPQSYRLDYLRTPVQGGWLGSCPAFRLQVWGKNAQALRNNLHGEIDRLLQRTEAPQRLNRLLQAASMRIDRLSEEVLKLPLKSTPEGEGSVDPRQEALLAAATEAVHVQKISATGLDGPLEELLSLCRQHPLPSLLVVAPGNSGKTTLIRLLLRALQQKDRSLRFFETRAGRLIRGLINETGWENNLPILARAIGAPRGILIVNNVRELLEVGQYVGNNISLGVGMQSLMKNGGLILFGECTPEEYEWMENRAPGFVRNFYRYDFDSAGLDRESILMDRAHQIFPGSRRTRSVKAAVRELLSLQRRFEPYAGQPGKALRFLEFVAAEEPGRPLNSSRLQEAYARHSGIPLRLLDDRLPLERGAVEETLGKSIFGQAQAVRVITDTILRLKSGLVRTNKPLASFLFAGPTGVGKTELAHALAHFLFGDRDRITRFDMSEYRSPYSLGRLLGTGSEGEGLLSGAVRRHPFGILLLDEIEKGHPNLLDLLLQVLGDGRLTGENGKTTDFGGTVVILTSNIGSERLGRRPIGWDRAAGTTDMGRILEEELLKVLRPELLNRIDEVVPFSPMNPQIIRQVLDREWAQFQQREGLRNSGIQVHLSAEARDLLAQWGFDARYGVRFLQRTLRKEIYLPLANWMRELDADEPAEISIQREGQRLVWRVKQEERELTEMLDELGKISQADQLSTARRFFEQSLSGIPWSKAERELQRLQWEAESNADSFQQQPERPKELGRLKDLAAGRAQLLEDLKQQEELAGMQVLAGRQWEEAEELIARWHKRLVEWSEDLLDYLHPETSSCRLFVLGKGGLPAARWYEGLLGRLEMDFEFYIRRPVRAGGNKEWKATAYPSSLAGDRTEAFSGERVFEFRVRNTGCLPLLQPEAGFQKWELEEDTATVAVLVQTDEQLPGEIDRKSFFARKPVRRSFGKQQITDNHYKLSVREPDPEAFFDKVADHLYSAYLDGLLDFLQNGRS